MVSHSGRPGLQSRGTARESWWGLQRWRPACRKSHKHEGGFFFSQKHKQQQLTAHPVLFLPPRSRGIIEAYKSPPDDIKLLE